MNQKHYSVDQRKQRMISAVKTLEKLGFTWTSGSEHWDPPVSLPLEEYPRKDEKNV
jgi:hypothetical protein